MPTPRSVRVSILLGILTVALGAGWLTAEEPRPAATGLPPEEIAQLLHADVARMRDLGVDAKSIGTQSKAVRTEALAIAVYAQVAIADADGGATRDLAAVRNAALAAAAAAEDKDARTLDRALKAATDGGDPLTEKPRSAHIPLEKVIPQTNLMEYVGLLHLSVAEYEKLTAEQWADPATRTEVARNLWRMRALMRAIGAHVPAADPNPQKGQTRKLWNESSAQGIDGAMQALSAVRDREREAFNAAIKKLDNACTRCHEAYRVE
jgi:hypothetical protein